MRKMALNQSLCRTGWCLLAAALGLTAWYARAYLMLPGFSVTSLSPIVPAMKWPDPNSRNIAFDGTVFSKQDNVRIQNLGPMARRFRLAGTFLAIGANQQSRKAVVDVLKNRAQQLVSEGEFLDETVEVKSILQNYIVLREGRAEEQLWLSFSEGAGTAKDTTEPPDSQPTALSEATLNRFGKRVGNNRWVLKRSSVLEYYREILNDTERLAKVFESMKPVYEGASIKGYVLDVEGEREVFNAFGLQQGDVIRTVNSMPMTSRIRAEYFIREFVRDRANAFVLDIERSGRAERLIYMMR